MAFKKVRHSHLYDQKNARWDVEIWQDSYTGSSVEFDMQGEGFEITWNGEGDTRNVVFLASELTLNYFVQNQTDEDFMYNDIFNDGQKKHYIRVYKTPNGGTKEIWWYGWVVANYSNLENAPFPYVTQITATDSYGVFKSRSKDTFTNHTDKTTHHKITEIIGRQDDPDSGSNHRGFLGRMNLMPSTDGTSNLTPCPHRKDGNESSGTNYSIIMKNMIEWFRRNADSSINDFNITYVQGGNTPLRDPFFNYYFSKSQFSKADAFDENDELIPPTGDALEYKESDVFDACLKIFGAVGVLSEGSYRFFQPFGYKYSIGEDAGEIPVYGYRTSTQMSEAITSREQQANTNDTLIIDQTNHVVLGGSNLTYEPALKDVSLSFDEGFTVTNVEQGVALDTSIGIGTLSNIDHGPIEISFFAQAKEVVNEPAAFSSSSVPRFTGADFEIFNHGIKTNTRLKIKQQQPDGTFKYLQQSTGSDILTWTNNENTINIIRGDIDNILAGSNESEPINNPNLIADGNITCDNFSNSQSSGDVIRTYLQGTNNDTRLTITDIRFTAFIEKPTNTGNIFIESPSRNLTTGSFIGHYKQMKSSGFGPVAFGTIGGADNNPTFVSSETISQQISIYYTELEQGETISSSVTYTSSQNTKPSNTSFDLGTTLIGQTPINPQASICFRNATASSSGGSPATYPSYNETDDFEIKPCETGFVRNDDSTVANIKNISKKVTEEFLSLQSEPLEILQADIFSADISPSKLLKYRIGGSSGVFKYYLFKGGTFKAQSATMSGEWYKVSAVEPTITNTFDPNIPPNPFPEPHGFGSYGGITPGGGVIDTIITGTEISVNTNTNNIVNNLNLNIIGKVGSALVAGTSYDRITLVANVVGKYYSGQKLFLAFPNGSNQLEVTCDNTATTGAFVDVATITPTTNYPVGSIVLVNTADLTNVITGSGGGGTPGGSSTQVQYNQAGAFKGEAGFEYDEGNNRLTVPAVNTPILQSISGGTTLHQIYTVSQNMAIATNTGVDVFLNLGNASSGTTAFSIKDYSGNIVFGVTDTGVIKAIGNKIQDSAGSDILDASVSGNTKLQSVNDLELNIASAGASSRSLKFINNTTEVGSIDSSGNLQIDGALDAASILNTSLVVGRDADNQIKFSTDNQIKFRYQGAERISISTSGLRPLQNNQIPLGGGTYSWSDLFLGDGAVINFNNGDVVLTHSANLLTITGGNVDIVGTLDTDNLTISGTQGTDGQVLTSTGSGVAWEDASGGGGTNTNIANADLTLNAGRTLNLSDNNLEIKNGTTLYLGFDDAGINNFSASDDLDIGNFDFRAKSFTSDVATGTAPLVVSSTTEVANLQSSTTANIGNLTGEVTSTNRATVIADNVVDEANLKVSNAPVNGYVLTAQSGNTGGLTWAEQSGGGGGSTTHRSILNCGFNDTSTAKGLFPFGHGGLSDTSASPSLQEFTCIVAPYDGYVDYVVVRCTGAAGTSDITFHKRSAGTAGVPATGDHSVSVSISANTAVKATFGATNGAFSAGDIIATGYDAGTTGLGDTVATMSIVYDLNNPL